MRGPLLSFLIPSRNRLDLLKHAITSIQAQRFKSLEIVVADNCSSEDYSGYLQQVAKWIPLKVIRSETPISVTDNWNAALKASNGQYVVMLGDDDALVPGYCKKMAKAIWAFGRPDIVYCMAYHYAYPGVMAPKPDGYFVSVKNSPIFSGTKPYRLDLNTAQTLSRLVLRFRHWFSFNAQHYIWKRDFIRRIEGSRRIFESPYPDYYASMVTFMKASSIVVVPDPTIIIGISKKSFGFSLINNMEEQGLHEFFHDKVTPPWFSGLEKPAKDAIALRGSPHYRNWLLAAIWARETLKESPNIRIDFKRYHDFQQFFSRNPNVEFGNSCASRIYYPAAVQEFDIGKHADIMDAFNYLVVQNSFRTRAKKALSTLWKKVPNNTLKRLSRR